jgi:hypothetical protein
MKTLGDVAVVVPVLLVDAGVWDGANQVLSDSSLPHNAQQWGAALGYMVLFVLARVTEFFVNRRVIRRAVDRSVVGGLDDATGAVPNVPAQAGPGVLLAEGSA